MGLLTQTGVKGCRMDLAGAELDGLRSRAMAMLESLSPAGQVAQRGAVAAGLAEISTTACGG